MSLSMRCGARRRRILTLARAEQVGRDPHLALRDPGDRGAPLRRRHWGFYYAARDLSAESRRRWALPVVALGRGGARRGGDRTAPAPPAGTWRTPRHAVRVPPHRLLLRMVIGGEWAGVWERSRWGSMVIAVGPPSRWCSCLHQIGRAGFARHPHGGHLRRACQRAERLLCSDAVGRRLRAMGASSRRRGLC